MIGSTSTQQSTPTRIPTSREYEERGGGVVIEDTETVIRTSTIVPSIETAPPLPISHTIPVNKLSDVIHHPSMVASTYAVPPTSTTYMPPSVPVTASPTAGTSASYMYPTKGIVEENTRIGPTSGMGFTTESPPHIAPSAIPEGRVSPPVQSRFKTPAMIPAQKTGLRLIVVAMDESDASRRALQWTLNQLLHPERDHLLIVTVATYKTAGFLAQNEEKTSNREAKAQARAERTLEYASNQIQDRMLRINQSISYELVSMKAADNYVRDVLVDYVSDIKADLMVMGSHAGGLLRRAILGSTSTYCLQHAAVPVIIVKHHSLTRT